MMLSCSKTGQWHCRMPLRVSTLLAQSGAPTTSARRRAFDISGLGCVHRDGVQRRGEQRQLLRVEALPTAAAQVVRVGTARTRSALRTPGWTCHENPVSLAPPNQTLNNEPGRTHSICATITKMKTAQLPPVRVEPAVRQEIEGALHDGESLSEFVEAAALQAARRRKAQEEFLVRGRASLADARLSGEFYPAEEVLNRMRARLDQRMDELRRKEHPPAAKA